MSQQPGFAASQPQAGDRPLGDVQGEGLTQSPGRHLAPTNSTSQGANISAQSTVLLNELRREPQWIVCPNCKIKTKTTVKGRSEGMQTFMDFMWWPLPNRKHWFETTHWLCGNCEYKLASQKNGKELRVLATLQ